MPEPLPLPPPAPGCEPCAARDELIAGQQRAVVQLQLMVERLTARVQQLERRLGRNSGNSSMPPSTDELPGRRAPAPKPASKRGSGRGRGKQRGAPGAGLSRVADPDVTVSLDPCRCAGCGASLADAAGAAEAGVITRQQFDLPPVRLTVTEYRLRKRRCRCGRVTTAPGPDGLAATPTSYGPNLQALVTYLLVDQHIPVQRAARLLAELTAGRVRLSIGFVHSLLARLGGGLAETERWIRAQLAAAAVVHVDETPLRAGPAPDRRQVHVAATDTLTAYYLGGRGADAVEEFGVLPGFTGVAVHDSYAVYDRYQHCRHQLCCAHLLRELVAAAEDHPDITALTVAHDTLVELIHLVNTARAAGAKQPPAEHRDRLTACFREAVLDALVAIPPQRGRRQAPARNLLERLHHRHADVVRFATDGYPHVPATNNQAERDLRPTKTQQKISGRLTSEQITQARLCIRGYLSTAAKHGIGALSALHAAATGHPWTPPAPA